MIVSPRELLTAEVAARHDLVEDDVAVGDTTLRIVRPRNADTLISEADYVRDERLPYWADVWPSSLALSAHLLTSDVSATHALELGCGLGITACALALRGMRVTATDYYPDALAFATANVAANARTGLETLLLDWRELPADLPEVPLVVAADVLYELPYGPLVAAALARLVAPGGEALVADPGRPACEAFLAEAARLGFTVCIRERRDTGTGTQRHAISIYALTRPGQESKRRPLAEPAS